MHILRRLTVTTAKVFRSGNSQAVRLPKSFRFDVDEVEIFRRGDEVVLREMRPRSLEDALASLPPWPDDIAIEDLAPEPREAW
jgi:antitoxin VapB